MNKRFLSAFLAALMLCGILLTSCTQIPEETEQESSSLTESTEKEQNTTGESSSENGGATEGGTTEYNSEEASSETEEETTVITDVMIGETLEAEYAADFSVAKIFSSDMVVQRNEQIRVWGFAPESENGKKVSATFKGMFAEALMDGQKGLDSNGILQRTDKAEILIVNNTNNKGKHAGKYSVYWIDDLIGSVFDEVSLISLIARPEKNNAQYTESDFKGFIRSDDIYRIGSDWKQMSRDGSERMTAIYRNFVHQKVTIHLKIKQLPNYFSQKKKT